jgi:hypothetical protein
MIEISGKKYLLLVGKNAKLLLFNSLKYMGEKE